MKLLPIDVGRFRLVDPGDDQPLRKATGALIAKDHAPILSGRGDLWVPCVIYPEPDLGVIHLALYEAGEMVGTFTPYSLITLSNESGVRSVSAMVAPVLASTPASALWTEDLAALMTVFLLNNLETSDGSYLSVEEWRFPLVERGDPPEHEWFGSTSANQGMKSGFISQMESYGILIEITDGGSLSRAVWSA